MADKDTLIETLSYPSCGTLTKEPLSGPRIKTSAMKLSSKKKMIKSNN